MLFKQFSKETYLLHKEIRERKREIVKLFNTINMKENECKLFFFRKL